MDNKSSCSFVVPDYKEPCDNLPLDKTYSEYTELSGDVDNLVNNYDNKVGGGMIKKLSDIVNKKMSLFLLDKTQPYLQIRKFIRENIKKSKTKLYIFSKGKIVTGMSAGKTNIKSVKDLLVDKKMYVFVLSGVYRESPWVYYYIYKNKKTMYSPYILSLKKDMKIWDKEYNPQVISWDSKDAKSLIINKYMKGGSSGSGVPYDISKLNISSDKSRYNGLVSINTLNSVLPIPPSSTVQSGGDSEYSTVIFSEKLLENDSTMTSEEMNEMSNIQLYSNVMTGGAKTEKMRGLLAKKIKKVLNKNGYKNINIKKYGKNKDSYIVSMKGVNLRGGVSYSFGLEEKQMLNGLPEVVKYDFCDTNKLGNYI